MALIFRRAVNADAAQIVALVDVNDADLVADYGSYVKRTAQEIRAMIADGKAEVIVAVDGAVLLGGTLFIQHPDGAWEVLLTVTEPALTAAQRLAGFKAMVRFVCANVPAGTVLWGMTKLGRRVDLALQSLPIARRDMGNGLVEFRTTAGVLLEVF
jgi:hypothetical protein